MTKSLAAAGLYGVLCLLLATATLGQSMFASVHEIEDQLLMTTGIDARSSIQVFDSPEKFLEAGAAIDLTSPVAGNTTVFGSVVVISNSSNSSSFSSDSAGYAKPQGQTQLFYNCTSAPNIWDYSQDANIDTTTFFQVAVLSNSETNTTLQARFALRNCDLQRNYSTNQIVVGNAFFGDEFAATNLHFRVQESDLEELDSDSPSGVTRCAMSVLLVRATVEELYPECDVKFKSTDVRSLFPNWRRRRNSSSSTGEPSAFSRDALTSSIDVYTKDALCDFECGVAATTQMDKFTAGFPGVDMCYDCSSLAQGDSCSAEFPYTTETACCRMLSCAASTAPIDSSDEDVMAWNLASDGVTVLTPEYVFHQSGDCSDPNSLSSDCCRVTCRDCYLQLELDTIEFHYSVLKFVASGEASVTGKGSITVAVLAPNGCLLEDDVSDIDLPFSDFSRTYWGFTVGVSIQLFRHNQLYIKTHNGEVVLGSNFDVQEFKGGFENAKTHTSGGIVHTPTNNPTLASLDIKMQTGVVFQVMVSLRFLKGLAAIRVGLQTEAFVKVEASVSMPQLFPGLPDQKLKNSQVTTGDCRLPHFMTYNMAGGFEDTKLIYGYTLLYRDSPDYFLNLPGVRYEKSYKSGCVAPAYSARFILAVQRSAIQALINDDARKERLLRALTRGLSFNGLDASGMRVVAISTEQGTVEVEMSVPPSIADEFATAQLFTAETNARAKRDFFRTYVSAEAGLPVNSVCPQGFWGTACDKVCSTVGCGAHTNCLQPTCDTVTGETYTCGACVAESWGSTCDIGCLPPDTCSNATCSQDTGVAENCTACSTGYWGDMCRHNCSVLTCVATKCDMATGTPISCTSCMKGFRGTLCEERDSELSTSGHVARPGLHLGLAVLVLVLQVLLL